MKACSVYVFEHLVVIYCEHLTPDCVRLVGEPMFKCERSKITPPSLGKAALEILDCSGDFKGIENFEVVTKAMVTFAGFKTWGAFANATDFSCSLRADKKKVTITPEYRDGRGFSPDPDGVVTCKPTATLLGKALFKVLELES